MWDSASASAGLLRLAGAWCRLPLALACLWAFAALPGSVAAQELGSVVGVVMNDADLTPVSGAVVTLPGYSNRARADEQGRFRLDDVPTGQVIVRIEAEDFVTFVESIEITAMEVSLIQFHLHRVAAVLDELLVDVSRVDDPARGYSEGRVVARDGVARTAADLLATSVPGISAQQTQGGAGMGVHIRMRGVSSFVLTEEPQIYLDGVRIDAGGKDQAMATLTEIPASSVRRIRVLRGPASASIYPNAAAGVILVETMGLGR